MEPSTSAFPLASLSALSAVIGTGCLTLVLASLLAYAVLGRRRRESSVATGTTGTTTPAAPSPAKKARTIDASQYPGGSLTIYFATQTGTAESLARDMEREGPHKGFFVHVVDVEDVAEVTLEALAPRSLFLVATYGEGESPDHAVPFVKRLQAAANLESLLDAATSDEAAVDADSTSGSGTVEYAVFGLGNRQYDHYNAMGHFMDRALSKLGAHRLVPLGLGDDNVDLEADFEAWKDTVWWPAVVQRYLPQGGPSNHPASSHPASIETKLPDCPLQVTYHAPLGASHSPNYNLPPEQIHSSSRHYFTAVECPVTLVRELQTSHQDSTVHVELDLSAAAPSGHSTATLTYTTADNLGVLPCNSTAVVHAVAHALGYDLDAAFTVTGAPGHEWHGAPFPMPCTVRECLTRYCDVTSAPRRSDLKLLASYCRDAVDRAALLRLAAKEGRVEYKEKILDSYTGLVDLLAKCPSLQMPLEHFLNVCSPLQTRFFTIASSSSVHPTTVHLTVAVTKHVRPDQSMFHGVCSTHLARLGDAPMTTVRVFHRPSSFRLPVDVTRPIVMVGPGTGVAPMRAFLQERAHQRNVLQQPVGMNILYFGCKQKSIDYIYRDELEDYVASGVLTHLRVAFSREQSEKVYVQHLIKENAAETWTLLHESGAHVYVCGGVKMGHDVSEALREIISSQGDMSLVAAKEYLTKMSHDGRFVQELWA